MPVVFSWLRYGIASMEQESYNKIQQSKNGDLNKVKENLGEAVRFKRDKKLTTVLGVQCLLLIRWNIFGNTAKKICR